MPEQTQQTQMTGRYALWIVPGAWWAVSLEDDAQEVIVPTGPLPWPTPCQN